MQVSQQELTAGLLVVDRKRSFPLPEFASSYRGFDATLWPSLQPGHPYLEAGIAPISSLAEVQGFLDQRRDSSELLFVTCEPGFYCPLPAQLAGYDLGILESGYNCFSVLLNEVLAGPLSAWRHMLNEHGLLRDPRQAQDLLHARECAVLAGEDLEELDRAPRVFAIYRNVRA